MVASVVSTEGGFTRYLSPGSFDGTFTAEPINVPAGADLEIIYWAYVHLWPLGNPGLYRAGDSSNGDSFFIFNGTSGRPWVRWDSTDVLKPTSGFQVSLNSWLQHRWRVTSSGFADFSTREDACDEWTVQHTANHAIATVSHDIYNLGYQNLLTEKVAAEWSHMEIIVNDDRKGLWVLDDSGLNTDPEVTSNDVAVNSVANGPGLVLREYAFAKAPSAPVPSNFNCDVGTTEPFRLRHNLRTNKVIPVLTFPTVTDIGANCVRPRVTKGY